MSTFIFSKNINLRIFFRKKKYKLEIESFLLELNMNVNEFKILINVPNTA